MTGDRSQVGLRPVEHVLGGVPRVGEGAEVQAQLRHQLAQHRPGERWWGKVEGKGGEERWRRKVAKKGGGERWRRKMV